VARRAHAYPQVMSSAADLVDGPVVAAPATLAATDAMRLARRRGADVLGAGERRWVLREDVVRADALGLGGLAIARLARPLPVVNARDSEIAVRRHLAGGAPAVVVMRGRAPLGVVRRAPPPATVSAPRSRVPATRTATAFPTSRSVSRPHRPAGARARGRWPYWALRAGGRRHP